MTTDTDIQENTIDPELLSQFIADALELLSHTDSLFSNLDTNPSDKDAIHEIFRITHNIKGNSGYINLVKTNRLAHKMEELLLVIREKENVYNNESAVVLKKGMAELKSVIAQLPPTGQENISDENLEKLITEISEIADTIKKNDTKGLWKSLTADLNLFTEKFNCEDPDLATILSRIVFSVAALTPQEKEQQKPETKKEAPQKQEPCALAPKPAAAQEPVQKTLKLGDEQMNKLWELSKKLTTAARNADQSIAKLAVAISEEVSKIKFAPAKNILNKVPLMANDVAKKQNKKVRTEVSGQNVLLERHQIEALEAPLTHLVRNAIDHGIESPKDRIAKGKPEEGLFSVKITEEADKLFISFSDDGKGIDTDAVKWKAVSKGVLPAEKASSIKKEEVYELLFLPGFSTADVASDISGRGVGMDVVKNSISTIGGSVKTESEIGKGTTFTIIIPKTI